MAFHYHVALPVYLVRNGVLVIGKGFWNTIAYMCCNMYRP